MSQTLEALNAALDAARESLNIVLAAGEDTTSARQLIAVCEAQVAAHREGERERIASERRAQDAVVERAAAEVAAQTHAAVDAAAAAAVPGLAELAGELLPAVERDPAIDAAAATVARARIALERAEAELRPHIVKASSLQQRLNEKRAAVDAIKRRRLEGDERAGDAGELALLQADIASLEPLHDDAKLTAASADTRPAARAALGNAEQMLHHARLHADLRAAKVRAELAERVLLDAADAARRAERAIGPVHPSACYAISNDLRKLVTGVPYR